MIENNLNYVEQKCFSTPICKKDNEMLSTHYLTDAQIQSISQEVIEKFPYKAYNENIQIGAIIFFALFIIILINYFFYKIYSKIE